MKTSQVVGRLAPSPTGAQHLGNARTYLLAWLSARAASGKIILRIEDIDSPRIKPWAAAQAIEDLRWLGLDWDEGPDVGGPNGPYVQTARTEHYQSALERLKDLDRIYPCSCTRTDIVRAASAPHLGDEGPIYPGTCAGWRKGGALPVEENVCWRFRTSDDELRIDDQFAGKMTMRTVEQLGDFPVTRKGGGAAYQLAVVVDDALMGVTEVVRGDDLLSSAFRQLEIYRALELRSPQFCHVPLVVGADGRRLAKRHGDTRLSWYREHGIKAEEIIGWAAYTAGLIERDEQVTAADLLQQYRGRFDWSLVTRGNVVVEGRFPVG